MKAWKLQKLGSDLVHDLRSRGLLPVAGLLLVCILAAPILISRMGSSAAVVPLAPAAESASEAAPEGQAAVLAYSPGVRNYRKRLDELASKDPFKQQFSDSGKAIDQATEAVDSGALAGSAFPGSGANGDSGGTGSGSGTGTGDGGGGSGESKTKTYYYSYQTDLRVGESGSELARRNKVPEFTLLPSEQAPALVFLGAAADGKQAIFSVSPAAKFRVPLCGR